MITETELMLGGILPKENPLNSHLNFYFVRGTTLCRNGEAAEQIDCRVTANALAAARNRVIVLEDVLNDVLVLLPEDHPAYEAAVKRIGYWIKRK